MRLYQFRWSPNAVRVRVAAAEVGVPLELIEVPYHSQRAQLAGTVERHFDPEYRRINPMGKVPTLVLDDGTPMWESPIICLWLAREHPAAGLLPEDPDTHLEMLRWMFFCASHLEQYVHGAAIQRVVRLIFDETAPVDEARVADCIAKFGLFAPVLDRRLAEHEWLAGPYSVADVTVGSTIQMAKHADMGVQDHPNLWRWLQQLEARPAWAASRWEK